MIARCKTVLSQFCEEFEDAYGRFWSRSTVSHRVSARRRTTRRHERSSGSARRRHRLRALMEKVERQQASRHHLRPLKSGKSTLMNAMSGAYVSEVTTPPAYPCMVYFSHAEQRELVLTRYDGSTERLSDVADMRTQMNTAHGELSRPSAPVKAAARSSNRWSTCARGAPGRRPHPGRAAGRLGRRSWSTRRASTAMKFGYDLMTRECRDSAASAAFVVKTDNLPPSRCSRSSPTCCGCSAASSWSNLDSTKQDLQPDGSLGSSLGASTRSRSSRPSSAS